MSAVPLRPIYLDHNATTPILPEVVEAMRASWSEPCFNAASQHQFGRRARQVLEDARDRIGELLGASPRDRVIFTSGGTESNNLAIRGLLARAAGIYIASPPPGLPTHLIISAAEHSSITAIANELHQFGHQFDVLPLSSYGTIRIDALRRLKRPETTLVAAAFGQNETGVLQPVAALQEKCSLAGIPVHTDATQVAGKLPINFRELGVATMTVAAHKFHGPLGIGALSRPRTTSSLQPNSSAAFSKAALRPGTETVALAVGMCRASRNVARTNKQYAIARMRQLRDRFEAILAGWPARIIVERQC